MGLTEPLELCNLSKAPPPKSLIKLLRLQLEKSIRFYALKVVHTQDQRLFTDLDQQRLSDLQRKVKTMVHADLTGRVLLDDVMNAVAAGVLQTKDREVIDIQTALHAYMDVAVPRFVDAIPMRLNDLILCKFFGEMTDKLHRLTDEKLTYLMQDSEQKMTERIRLKEELACLTNAKKEIELVF
ncbi:unnamed protein product [Phytophthora fragariaefolia]|uniref:Unnamed protein product n=1 Tax=Phytophthora fragariaefolia TaxID=1490495 RepID=A0A9W6YLY5_9STRA|nr:unnamed protein product [Phytophthora fragariaefolia]